MKAKLGKCGGEGGGSTEIIDFLLKNRTKPFSGFWLSNENFEFFKERKHFPQKRSFWQNPNFLFKKFQQKISNQPNLEMPQFRFWRAVGIFGRL